MTVTDLRWEGRQAALDGEGISACPFGPTDPEGKAWRQGWISAEASLRQQAGTFDHTPDEYAAYKASIGWSDEQLRDPVVEILGGYDPLPERTDHHDEAWPSVHFTVTFSVDVQQAVTAITDAMDKFTRAFVNIDFTKISDALQGIAEQPSAEPKAVVARRRERVLLNEQRRSHRRTNRWGRPPGRH